MMNNMPPYGMYPPMGPYGMYPNNNNMPNEQGQIDRIASIENQISRIERQLRRMDARITRIENSMTMPLNSQDTGYGGNGSKYMM